jgi:hypothetical protein
LGTVKIKIFSEEALKIIQILLYRIIVLYNSQNITYCYSMVGRYGTVRFLCSAIAYRTVRCPTL